MARKKKGKAKKNASKNALREIEEISRAPHSFVFERGHVGNNVSTLAKDMRLVMEPYTATNLKLRKKNVLKDLVSIAGPLNVTNFIMFSKSPNGTNMRIARLPRGPTLYFQVTKYSLNHDIVSALKRPQTSEGQFRHPPLLVLNNFKDTPNKSDENKGNFEVNPRKLCATMLQNMFPSINIHKVKLNQVKRCVSFSYDQETDLIEFRHFNIAVKPMGMSRRLKKLVARKDLPDLSKYSDISEYLTQKPGEGSASESEADPDGPHNEVELPPTSVSGKDDLLNQKCAIRLTELGPRMTLRLIKCEEGLCSGDVLYHSLIDKTKDELEETLKKKAEKKKLKAKRKAEQAKNVAKKQEEKETLKKKSLAGMKRKLEENEDSDDDFEPETPKLEQVDDDAEWYRKEVGQEPDKETFATSEVTKKFGGKKRRKTGKDSNFKKPKNTAFEGQKKFNKSKVFKKKASFAKKKKTVR
ncbi:suppressor of SWI4 1 homolog [Styela clava]